MTSVITTMKGFVTQSINAAKKAETALETLETKADMSADIEDMKDSVPTVPVVSVPCPTRMGKLENEMKPPTPTHTDFEEQNTEQKIGSCMDIVKDSVINLVRKAIGDERFESERLKSENAELREEINILKEMMSAEQIQKFDKEKALRAAKKPSKIDAAKASLNLAAHERFPTDAQRTPTHQVQQSHATPTNAEFHPVYPTRKANAKERPLANNAQQRVAQNGQIEQTGGGAMDSKALAMRGMDKSNHHAAMGNGFDGPFGNANNAHNMHEHQPTNHFPAHQLSEFNNYRQPYNNENYNIHPGHDNPNSELT